MNIQQLIEILTNNKQDDYKLVSKSSINGKLTKELTPLIMKLNRLLPLSGDKASKIKDIIISAVEEEIERISQEPERE
jgi:hypothetical protein